MLDMNRNSGRLGCILVNCRKEYLDFSIVHVAHIFHNRRDLHFKHRDGVNKVGYVRGNSSGILTYNQLVNADSLLLWEIN